MKALAIVLAAALPLAVASSAWAKGAKKGDSKKADKAKADDDDDDDDDAKKPDKKADKKKADAEKKKADAEKKKADAEKKKSDDDDDKKSDDKKSDDKAESKAAVPPSDDSDDGGDDDKDGGFSNGKKIKVKDTGEAPMVKQDLNGHDMGSKKKTTEFERDRFFVDKTDTEKTADKTLVQGSLTSSTFFYTESGGALAAPTGVTGYTAGDNKGFSRYFTDLRLQTDLRHLSGGKWDARIDARIRVVNTPDQVTEEMTNVAPNPNNNVPPTPQVQGSGLDGGNEYDIRELWLVRNGVRTDITIGRQYIADLAALKIDGLRVDYASSPKITYLGFAGLYPFRGSRSITTDYIALKNPIDLTPAGKFIGAGGFGAAYRTPTSYGAFGGVLQQALDGGSETRFFGTANGYWRVNPTLDIYHYAVIDLLASNGPAQLTNLSGGINYKPNNRLRMTASYNRVDTETLSIQAGAYLDQVRGNPAIQNEIFLARLSTNEARGSISAGLGNLERFEITAALTYRNRPGFTIDPLQTGAAALGALPLSLTAERGYEVYGSIMDRHSIKDLRLGLDGMQTFTVGSIAFQRSEVFSVRAFASRELDSGRGEWELEGQYTTTKDISSSTTAGMYVPCADVGSCYGATSGTIINVGGTLYYRINRDWFLIGQANVSHTALDVIQATGAAVSDPAITGLSGYFRIAYRF